MLAVEITAPMDCRVVERPLPCVGADQVLVKIAGCGVCASSLPVWEGRPWFNYPIPPGLPGHEAWGWAEGIGSQVKTLKIGDAVAILSTSGFAEYELVDSANVVRVPSALFDNPFPGEAIACAVNIFDRARIESGQRVAIVGAGFLGLILTQLISARGAEAIVISRRPSALRLAQQFGALGTFVFDNEVPAEVKELTSDRGYERVIEAVGNQSALDLASALVAERGLLVIAGYHQDGPRTVDMQSWNWRGIDVINAHERSAKTTASMLQRAVDHIEDGTITLAPMLKYRFKLDALNAAFQMMRDRPDGFVKGVITL